MISAIKHGCLFFDTDDGWAAPSSPDPKPMLVPFAPATTTPKEPLTALQPPQTTLKQGELIPGLYGREVLAPKTVAVTIDDGPMPVKNGVSRTSGVLDQLAAHHIKATFFLNGRNITKDTYKLVKRMVAEGHALGNHTQNHLIDLHKHSPASIAKEIDLTQALVDLALTATSDEEFESKRTELLNATTFPTEHAYKMKYLRPPGGGMYFSEASRRIYEKQFAKILNERGLAVVMWKTASDEVDADPIKRQDPQVVNMHMTGLRGPQKAGGKGGALYEEGGVMLMHDYLDRSAFERLLTTLETDQFDAASLDKLMALKYGP